MRQISMFKFVIGTQEMKARPDGLFELVKTPITEVVDTCLTKTDARKALAEAGHPVKRGADVYWDKVEKHVMYFETEKLLSIIDHVEVEEL